MFFFLFYLNLIDFTCTKRIWSLAVIFNVICRKSIRRASVIKIELIELVKQFVRIIFKRYRLHGIRMRWFSEILSVEHFADECWAHKMITRCINKITWSSKSMVRCRYIWQNVTVSRLSPSYQNISIDLLLPLLFSWPVNTIESLHWILKTRFIAHFGVGVDLCFGKHR